MIFRDGKPGLVRLVCVTKQPILPGFPSTIIATSKRRLQAAIRATRCEALRDSICGYARLFGSILSADFLRSVDQTPRNRHFGQLPVFWAWLAQILEGNASCSKALSLIQAWSRAAGLPVPTGNSSGYCQARARISMEFLKSVLARVNRWLDGNIRPADLWNGHVLKAIDGSSVQLMDTPSNQKVYPQPSGQKPGCGFPTMGIVGIQNLSHGGWEGFIRCKHTAHDSSSAARLLVHVQEDDILLGDRAFCSYELFALLLARKAHAVMRLHQARHAKLHWPKGKKAALDGILVEWHKPSARRLGSTLSQEAWDALPPVITVRYVRESYTDREGRRRVLVVATTLLDADKYKAGEVAGLYARRWDIELKLRDIKTTLGMDRFDVRSPEMAERVLWMMMIAANLLRCLMRESAAEARVAVWQVSFKGVLDQSVACQESYLAFRGKPRCLRAHHGSVVEICATKLIVLRPDRQQPRALKRRPKNYPLLTRPRHEFTSPPHRGKRRAAA